MYEFWDTTLSAPMAGLGRTVVEFVPKLLAMVVILALGWMAALAIGIVVERFLRIIGLDHLSNRIGFTGALLRGGIKTDPSRLIGRASYVLLLLLTASAALGTLNLEPLNRFAQSSLSYLPHLFTAAVILGAGYLFANFVSQGVLIAAVNAGFPAARMAAGSARLGVQLIAIAMALEQLGIARTIVDVAFGLTFGGVVMAAAIAFGLGAKDLAKSYLERRLTPPPSRERPDDLRHL